MSATREQIADAIALLVESDSIAGGAADYERRITSDSSFVSSIATDATNYLVVGISMYRGILSARKATEPTP